ncbi:outer membrane receptor for ferrienterochelin and colicin [Pedobacter cryoconitis]|uniref:TonB-dependent receptor n=1 Tax=Pedobacter cryoconitis TaxID=188932 RepID=UPI00160F6ABE|nr:TonB-dependent receptor [Pedobacter cryoconitis]MBB6272430.1 outer membrane receptor for ferrienterochelin and colicin [Pedobacter cryoconitis]
MKRFLFLLFISAASYAQTPLGRLNGKVVDTDNRPVQYASVYINEREISTYTNETGEFSIRQSQAETASLTLRISFVGKQTITRTIQKADFNVPQHFILQELSLTLDNVVVSSERKRSDVSNSAITFDRQAIEQVQAYSLADILYNLPGKKMAAPDLQYLQNITLRSASSSDPVQAANNSLGVAIYVDGFRQANDANMQTRNVGMRGMINGAINRHRDPNIGNSAYDSPFGGLDIRNIPSDNIESIEVVSGVASAKYGEMTDGAIIIERKAGQTPYEFAMRLNGNSTNYSLSKGVNLGKKAGALNISLNYLNSIQDPRNSLKNYRRINTGLMWSVNILPNLRNTFSLDYSYKKDNARADEDDSDQESVISLDRKISVSNRTSLQIQSPYLKRITLGMSFDKGYSNSYRQYFVNDAVKGIGDKDTTGTYEGYFIPGNYLGIDHIIGEPYNFSSNLSLDNNFNTGQISHVISLGASVYTAGNSGQGVIADPKFPGTNTSGFKSERPYNFDLQKNIMNAGFYLQDKADYMLFDRLFTANAGIRYDIQNGFASIQPRINVSYQLNKKWSVRGAYGISTKAPGMSQRYPSPTYFDIPLINSYNGRVNESLYLVHTEKIVPDNSTLKPSRSSQLELGVTADYHFFNTSLYGFMKKNRDGFNTRTSYLQIVLPEYTYSTIQGEKPVYQESGKFKMYSGLTNGLIDNTAQSDNYGIEWFLSTKKITAIQTSLNMNTSFGYTRYNDLSYAIYEADVNFREQGKKAWYGIYPANKSSNLDITTKISTDTHIPKLGFVVSVLVDIYWKNRRNILDRSFEPFAYLDKDGNYHAIDHFDPNNPDYGYLSLMANKASTQQSPPFVYSNVSLRIAKEMKKKFRIAVYAYNFLNIMPKYYNRISNSITTYNSPVNVGGEISFRF